MCLCPQFLTEFLKPLSFPEWWEWEEHHLFQYLVFIQDSSENSGISRVLRIPFCMLMMVRCWLTRGTHYGGLENWLLVWGENNTCLVSEMPAEKTAGLYSRIPRGGSPPRPGAVPAWPGGREGWGQDEGEESLLWFPWEGTGEAA